MPKSPPAGRIWHAMQRIDARDAEVDEREVTLAPGARDSRLGRRAQTLPSPHLRRFGGRARRPRRRSRGIGRVLTRGRDRRRGCPCGGAGWAVRCRSARKPKLALRHRDGRLLQAYLARQAALAGMNPTVGSHAMSEPRGCMGCRIRRHGSEFGAPGIRLMHRVPNWGGIPEFGTWCTPARPRSSAASDAGRSSDARAPGGTPHVPRHQAHGRPTAPPASGGAVRPTQLLLIYPGLRVSPS